jgi:mono/diheme cytochrome c family protein
MRITGSAVRSGSEAIDAAPTASSRKGPLTVLRLFAFGFAAAIAFSLGAGVASAEADPRVEAGGALYQQYCSACHGINADGQGLLAPVLDPKPGDLTRIAARHDGVFPDAEISRFIDGRDPVVGHGSREMPVWGRRFGEGLYPGPVKEYKIQGDITMLIVYLKSLQVPE